MDKQEERREFYGKAGLFRPKEYGIEYRTLSNFWLDPKWNEKRGLNLIINNVFSLAMLANKDHKLLSEIYKIAPWADIEQAVNTEDIKLSTEILNHVAPWCPFTLYSYRGNKFHSSIA